MQFARQHGSQPTKPQAERVHRQEEVTPVHLDGVDGVARRRFQSRLREIARHLAKRLDPDHGAFLDPGRDHRAERAVDEDGLTVTARAPLVAQRPDEIGTHLGVAPRQHLGMTREMQQRPDRPTIIDRAGL